MANHLAPCRKPCATLPLWIGADWVDAYVLMHDYIALSTTDISNVDLVSLHVSPPGAVQGAGMRAYACMVTHWYTPTGTLRCCFVRITFCIWGVRCRVDDVRYTDADLRRELATLVQGNSSMCAKLLLGKVPDGAAIMHSDAAAALDLWGRCLVSIQLNDQQVPLSPRRPRGPPAAAAASPY